MYKVVIIDDEKIIRDGLRKIVPWQSLGCEIVAEASNGIYGIELIRKVQPDIILTDIRMPGVDGLTMLEETLDVAGNAKVIIITGYRDFDYAQKAIRLGAFDFLVKPTDIDRLISSIKAIVKELDKIADKSNYLNEDIISEYNKSSKLVNINIVLSKLTDSVCMGNMEESSVCYDE